MTGRQAVYKVSACGIMHRVWLKGRGWRALIPLGASEVERLRFWRSILQPSGFCHFYISTSSDLFTCNYIQFQLLGAKIRWVSVFVQRTLYFVRKTTDHRSVYTPVNLGAIRAPWPGLGLD